MKIKSLSDLGNIYGGIAAENHVIPETVNESSNNAVQQTDTSVYLTETKFTPEPGSALGGGPGVKKVDGSMVTPPWPKSGPEGLNPKKGNFKKIDKVEDPGTDDKVMKDEEESKEDEKGNMYEKDGAKITTPKEKVQETVAENNKYNYKPKFTMSKSKFEQLYEESLKRIPFNEADDMSGMDAGVPPADDMAADTDMSGPEGMEEPAEELPTHEEAIEMLEKILKFLKKDEEFDKEHGDLGDEDMAIAGHSDGEEEEEEEESGIVAEDVEAEDEGHVLTKVNGSLKKGNPDAVNKPMTPSTKGTNKATGGKAVDGKIRNEPEPKEVEGDESAMKNHNKLQNTKKFTTNAAKEPKVGDSMFD